MEDYSIFLQLPLELWTLILPHCSLEMSLVSLEWRRLAFPLTFHDPRVADFPAWPFVLDAPCAHGHVSVVRELLKHPSLTLPPHKCIPKYFLYACKYGHVEIVRLLLACPTAHSTLISSFIFDTSWLGKIFAKWGQKKHIFTPSVTHQVMILQLILPDYPLLDQLLESACWYGLDTRILRLFLEQPHIGFGRNTNLSLRHACECGNLDNIRLLLEADKRPVIMVDYEPLFHAADKYASKDGDDDRHTTKILKVLLRDERIYYNTNVCKQILCASDRTVFQWEPDARRLIRRWALAIGVNSPYLADDVTPFLFEKQPATSKSE